MQQLHGIFEDANGTWQAAGILQTGSGQSSTLTLTTTQTQLVAISGPIGGAALPATPLHIHGVLSTAGMITLPQAQVQGRQWVPGADAGTVTLLCPRVLIGSVAFPTPEFGLDAASIEPQWLKQWLERPVVQAYRPFAPLARGVLVRMRKLPREVMSVTAGDETFEIVLEQFGTLNTVNSDDHRVTESAQLVVIPHERKPLAWFEEQERKLWLLLGLLSGRDVRVVRWKGVLRQRQISRFAPSVREFIWPDGFSTMQRRQIRMVFDPFHNDVERTRADDDDRQASPPMRLLTGQSWSPALATVLRRWFEQPTLAFIVGLLVAATRQDDYYIESRLANLAQALEAMHRFLHPERTKYLTPSELRAVRDSLRANWPESVPDEHRDRMLNQLPNSVTLRTRLIELFEEVWPLIAGMSDFQSAEDIAVVVEKHRNSISHGAHSGLGNAGAVARLNKLLAQVLRYFLLKQLGWEGDGLAVRISGFENVRVERALLTT